MRADFTDDDGVRAAYVEPDQDEFAACCLLYDAAMPMQTCRWVGYAECFTDALDEMENHLREVHDL